MEKTQCLQQNEWMKCLFLFSTRTIIIEKTRWTILSIVQLIYRWLTKIIWVIVKKNMYHNTERVLVVSNFNSPLHFSQNYGKDDCEEEVRTQLVQQRDRWRLAISQIKSTEIHEEKEEVSYFVKFLNCSAFNELIYC